MPNDQSHDPRVSTAGERVAQAVGLTVAAVNGALEFGTSAFRVSVDELTRSGTLTITTDTHDFGAKPVSTKPYLVWIADDGQAPNTTLGRAGTWNDGTSTISAGSLVSDITGQGQSQCHVTDLSAEATSFTAIPIPATRKKFVHRRRYDEFDHNTADAIRTRVDLTSGDIPTVGQTVTGQTSGATGVVQSVDPDGLPRYAIFYEPSGGTINNDPPTDFEFGEVMSWSGGEGTNSEGSAEFPTGTYRTFNNKILRMYPKDKVSNFANIYFGEGDTGRWVVEGTGGLINDTSASGTDSPHNQADLKESWVTDIYKVLESSAQGVSDAAVTWQKNADVIAPGTTNFVSYDATYPDLKETMYLHQVSNGCQPGTKIRIDYLYIDDSWYYVTLADSVSGREIPLPPKTWGSTQVECAYLPFENWTHIRLYKDGALIAEEARP